MRARRISSKNKTALYVIAVIIIVVFFLLLGGAPWLKGLSHGSGSIGIAHWNWVQILISLGIGFLMGILFSKRKW